MSTTPETQLAAVIAAPKAPVEIKRIPVPTPGAGSVIIKVHSAAFNPLDSKLFLHAIIPIPYPAVLGTDIAGTIVSSSPGSSPFSPGDRVGGYSFFGQTACTGGYQQYAEVPAAQVFKLPDSRSFDEASALPMGFLTAAAALDTEFGIRPEVGNNKAYETNSKKILITGGGSSVGGYAIQLAAAAGWTVVTTASSSKHNALKKLGARECVAYGGDVEAATVALRAAGSYDAVLDAVAVPASFDMLGRVLEGVDNAKIVAVVPDEAGTLQGKKVRLVFKAWPENILMDAGKREWAMEYMGSGKVVATSVEVRHGGLRAVKNMLEEGVDGYGVKIVVRPWETEEEGV